MDVLLILQKRSSSFLMLSITYKKSSTTLKRGYAKKVYSSRERVSLFLFFSTSFCQTCLSRGKMASGGAAPEVTLIKNFDQLLKTINEAGPEKVSARQETIKGF